MLEVYKSLLRTATPLLHKLLALRVKRGKEDPARLGERQGKPSTPRPDSPLLWVHAASVGESQSALILLERLQRQNPEARILMTTGTLTSAAMMRKNLPANAIHQFIPLDHPEWVAAFLSHWRPDLVLWMESELWPNMLLEIKVRKIPAILVNARLSEKSFRRWSWVHKTAHEILSAFSVILAQSEKESARYKALGAGNVITTGNLKYSAKPLPFDENNLTVLNGALANRPLWLYASSHKGEEALACRVHQKLKNSFPDLLTIIVPRHPARREDITQVCENHKLKYVLRGEDKKLPTHETDIYIADTMGELGLFYRLAPVACIGRSFSDDGGGGHNPIEAAQLNCAVLHGPDVQFQKELFAEMHLNAAAMEVKTESELAAAIYDLLSDKRKCENIQKTALDFTHSKAKIVDVIIDQFAPWLENSGLAGNQKLRAQS